MYLSSFLLHDVSINLKHSHSRYYKDVIAAMSDKASRNPNKPTRRPATRSPFQSDEHSEITPAPLPAIRRPNEVTRSGLESRRKPQSSLATPSVPLIPSQDTRLASTSASSMTRSCSIPLDIFGDHSATPLEYKARPARNPSEAQTQTPVGRAAQNLSDASEEVSIEVRKVQRLLEISSLGGLPPGMMEKLGESISKLSRGEERVEECAEELRRASGGAEKSPRGSSRTTDGSSSSGSNRGSVARTSAGRGTTGRGSAGPVSRR